MLNFTYFLDYLLKIGLPAPFVAKIALKMYNALASYMIANNIGNKSNNFALEMRNLVTVRNFLVNDRAGQLNIRFYGECQLGKLTDLAFRDVVQMSPEQLKVKLFFIDKIEKAKSLWEV